MSVVIVGAGTNLGAREAALVSAVTLLDARPGIEVVDVSPYYETPPLGPPQDDYLNAAFRIETALPPPELLQTLLRIERRLGRRRQTDLRWGPRSIDLDLLWDSRGSFHSSELDVPHRELERRNFALGPMLDVAPELEPQYRVALENEGGRPNRWGAAPSVEERVDGTFLERTVDADTLVDACAAGVRSRLGGARPWSTRHAVVGASLDDFAAAVRRLFRSGFQCCCTTVSHCSQTQWTVEFHGADTGLRYDADVRYATTSADPDRVRVRFAVGPSPRK